MSQSTFGSESGAQYKMVCEKGYLATPSSGYMTCAQDGTMIGAPICKGIANEGLECLLIYYLLLSIFDFSALIYQQGDEYRKFSIKGATPYKGAPPFDPEPTCLSGFFLAISQPKMIRFSFCKNPLEDGKALSLMRAPLRSSLCPQRPY